MSLRPVLLTAWVLGWLWIGRYYVQDDALIHLRYARNLLATGHLTYDGVRPTYGSSSPAFVGFLAAGYAVYATPLLPKIVSSLVYALGLALVVRGALRSLLWTRRLTLALLIVLAAPMGVRWFTDGMETGLAALMATALAYWAFRSATRPDSSVVHFAAGVTLGLLTTLCRIELVMLAVAASVAGALLRYDQATASPDRGARFSLVHALRESHLAAGAALALLATQATFGQISRTRRLPSRWGECQSERD